MGAAERRRRLVFLCSGGGGNLRFVHHAAQRGWIRDAEIAAVLTDRHCPANSFAASAGIAERSLDFQAPGQPDLVQALGEYEPDLVVTTVHRILHKEVVGAYRGKLLNLHYSLLPAFGGSIGARPVEAALDYGARFAGVTTHEVDETVDGGRPVTQAVFPLQPGEPPGPLMNLVFRSGCLALLGGIQVLLKDRPGFPGEIRDVLGRPCMFSARIDLGGDVLDEALWAELAAESSDGRGAAVPRDALR